MSILRTKKKQNPAIWPGFAVIRFVDLIELVE